jgi:hypothetical protein
MAHPVVQALATVDAVIGIVCFGSYALGTADAESDLDLYVICHPLIVPEAIRRSRFEAIPGVSEIHLHYETPGWGNAWAPQSDRLTMEPLVFDLSYTTSAWLTPVVHRVLTEGALTLPEMAFRPYTLCGLLAQAIPLCCREIPQTTTRRSVFYKRRKKYAKQRGHEEYLLSSFFSESFMRSSLQ